MSIQTYIRSEDHRSFAFLVGQFHKLFYFFVDVLLAEHTQVVIVLLASGNLRDLAKAQIIVVGFVKREYHVDKALTQLYHKRNTRLRCKSDHGLCGLDRYFSDLLIALCKMPEQGDRVIRFSIQEISQFFVSAGMYLRGIDELLSTLGACPHDGLKIQFFFQSL
jgi:hypothetical protein